MEGPLGKPNRLQVEPRGATGLRKCPKNTAQIDKMLNLLHAPADSPTPTRTGAALIGLGVFKRLINS